MRFPGKSELTGLATAAFHTLAFELPGWVVATLTDGCPDFAVSIALNVPWNASGTYLLDNLRIGTAGDLLTPVLSCVFQRDPDRLYSRWAYESMASTPIAVPVGVENSFSPGEGDRGQPTTFLPGLSAPPFTVPFDGEPLSWRLGQGLDTASKASVPCPSTWVPAWTGRGPLSTTITTNRTSLDPVPDLTGRTFRLMTHLTTAGTKLKVKLSQRFSSESLDIAEAHVALRAKGSSIDPASDRPLTFGGNAAVSVPAGEELLE